MARIDHAAEAAEWIADAPHALHGTSGEQQSTDRAVVCALLAQAQATLALVEQQRIANLIALPNLDAYATLYADERLRPDIAAALGIEVQS